MFNEMNREFMVACIEDWCTLTDDERITRRSWIGFNAFKTLYMMGCEI